MQNQHIIPTGKSQPARRCRNFGCDNVPAPGWQCCDSSCGFQYSRDKGYLGNVAEGRTDFRDPFWGISRWPVEKILYYLKLLPCHKLRLEKRNA